MIRKMRKEDAGAFLNMTELFYASKAVSNPIPRENHINTFNEIIRSNDYIEGYIFEYEDKPVGYVITTRTYSHEAGGITLWIDELFILEEYRSMGLGKEFFSYLKSTLDASIIRLRLEVESDNDRAINFYQRMGFNISEYDLMYKDRQINNKS